MATDLVPRDALDTLRPISLQASASPGAAPVVTNGSLVPWALGGALLLNAVLTVQRGVAGRHAGHGWERINSAIVRAVARRETPSVFLLWGARSKALRPLIDESRHGVITSSHPSPCSAWRV